MSFFEPKEYIEDGDLVLAWMNRANIRPITVKKGTTLHTQYGSFPHDKLIGTKYGTQVGSTSGANSANGGRGGRASATGFIHVLAPSPELWSVSLRHRTQIVYTPDASYIVQRLNIRPGSRVIEAGTGSGSFTHALSRTLGSSGQLFTYEFHGPRYEEALKEVQENGLDTNTVITHRDVCMNGFSNPSIENSARTEYVQSKLLELNKQPAGSDIKDINIQANAVFLDLPSPWLAIPHLEKVLNTDRQAYICCFSPCIEQVSRAVDTLKKQGWKKIEMVEVSSRRWEAHKEMVKSVNDAVDRLRDIKRRRVVGLKKRNERIAKEREEEAKKKQKDAEQTTSNDDELEDEEMEESEQEDEANDDDEKPRKKAKLNNDSNQSKTRGFNPWGKGQRIKEGDERFSWVDVSKIEPEIKTHTSYLTFAILPPKLPSALVNADGVIISSLPVTNGTEEA